MGSGSNVDLRLGLDLKPPGNPTNLARRPTTREVAEAVRSVVEGPPFSLIEALAEAIAARILRDFPVVERVDVTVTKPSAPIAAVPSGMAAVEISRERDADNQTGQATRAERGSVLGADTLRALCSV